MRDVDYNIYEDILGIKNEHITLFDFLKKVSDEDKCLEFIYYKKYGFNNTCKCKISNTDTFKKVKNRKSYQCCKCGFQIYPMSGTIFNKTRVTIGGWLYLMYNSSISKKNISAIQAAKNIGVSYETSHRMMKMIRKNLFQERLGKFTGIVEIDEAFIGGGSKWHKWGSICKTRKQPILGIMERESGLVKVILIEKRDIQTLDEVIENHVEYGSIIYTDGWRGYMNLNKKYTHDIVEHSKREYVRGQVHTNKIENFWGIMKRNIRGAHTKVGYKYVQNYMDEIVWKFNHRDKSPLWRFNNLIDRAISNTIAD